MVPLSGEEAEQPAKNFGAKENERGECDGAGPCLPRNIRIVAPVAYACVGTGGDEVAHLAGGLCDDAQGADACRGARLRSWCSLGGAPGVGRDIAADEVVADGDQSHRHHGEQRQAPPDGGDS